MDGELGRRENEYKVMKDSRRFTKDDTTGNETSAGKGVGSEAWEA